jgi:4-hydroxybenzoate polyprenyltransferase
MASPTFAKASAGKRSRPRSYLLLARVSNLPTVWTNVLAAYVGAIAGRVSIVDYIPEPSLPAALVSMSLFYMAGMFLNDVCDAPHDARARSDRPIPNGDVSRGEALTIALALMAAAEAILLPQPYGMRALPWSVALIAAITVYDFSHKGKWYGPIVMGLCRALVYCVVASSATGTVATAVLIAAVVMWLYVIALTWVAKAANLGYAVPWMLAGICLVDAAMIWWMGYPRLSIVAAVGFPLTLAFQRVVPGT